MDINKIFFLNCLSDFLNERKTEPRDGINWETVYNYALKHQLINIIEYQCGEFMSKTAAAYFAKSGKASLFYRLKIDNTISILTDVCKNLDIEYAFLKGPVVAQFYSVPEFRSMGDVDLAVSSENRKRVLDALLEKGFENKSKNDDHEWVFTYNGIEVELHDKLIYKEVFNNEKQDDFLNNMWGYIKDGKIDASFHFIYLLHHLKKHLTSSGAGFRQFFDIACVSKNCSELDWDWILKTLDELEMLDFANMCFALCHRWFDADIDGSGVDDDFYEEATDKIFSNGVFGFADSDNRFNMSVNRVNAGKNRFFSYFSTILNNLFPGYGAMSAMEQYSFLRGRPYLLPAAWIYRAFWGIRHGQQKRFNSKLDSIVVPKDKIDKRKEELKRWRLDK